ncbi:hypothetical protein HYW21_01995 [Candidatus Woesearchaeota archaeon]|nr:hypothetical protein [Candidatus Woesearchaeota archaeon]
MMLFVIDSNVIFTYFWKTSVLQRVIQENNVRLVSPVFGFVELQKYEDQLQKKVQVSNPEFQKMKQELTAKVNFVPLKWYASALPAIAKIAQELPLQESTELMYDVDFLALALTCGCPLWSNDKLLKKQQKVLVYTTEEILLLID